MPDASTAIRWALQQMGKPYKFGAAGPSAFDCSGLILKAYQQMGFNLPHKAALQQEVGYEVGLSGAQPGDLVFFSGGPTAIRNKNGLNIGHVAMYVGNGYVLEAFSSKDKVRIRQIGTRANKVVSVKRLATPSQVTITVPGSPWTPSSGPQAMPFIIPASNTRAPGSGMVAPVVPAVPSMAGVGTGSANAAEISMGYAGGIAPNPYSGGSLSDDQLVQVLATAGFRGEELVTAFAIAKRESGGNPKAFNGNGNTGDQSYGLFQINMIGKMGPARLAQYGLSSNEDLYDPLTNARVAFQMAHETSTPFYHWGPYKGRPATYGTDVQGARAAVQGAITSGAINIPWTGGEEMTYLDPSLYGFEYTPPSGDPMDTARQLFGYMAAYLDHEEIGHIIQQAAIEGWDESRLQGALFNTEFWQQTQDTARVWDANKELDPASAEGQIKAQVSEMINMAQQMGIAMGSWDRVREIAEESLRMGWSEAQLEDAMGAEIMRDPKLIQQVTEGQVGRQVSNTAFQYGIMLSDDAKRQWASQIAAGQSTGEDFTRYAIAQAKSYYNSADLSAALDRGVSVRQYADPYVSLAANTLGLNAEDIDLTDPKWMKSIAFVDAQGTRRPMNLDEWGRNIRQDPAYGYDSTPQAVDRAYSIANALGSLFGKAPR